MPSKDVTARLAGMHAADRGIQNSQSGKMSRRPALNGFEFQTRTQCHCRGSGIDGPRISKMRPRTERCHNFPSENFKRCHSSPLAPTSQYDGPNDPEARLRLYSRWCPVLPLPMVALGQRCHGHAYPLTITVRSAIPTDRKDVTDVDGSNG